MSEDAFRDEVVRPLFKLQGLKSYRDVCGLDEEGKDCIMFREVEFRAIQMYAVQTKRGKLNMSRHATANVETAITQLRTALNTPIACLNPRRRQTPDVVYLCTSGVANTAARNHIVSTLTDSRIHILDVDEVIAALDELYPTFWLHISHHKRRYLETFRTHLLKLSDVLALSSCPGDTGPLPYTDEAYVSQRLFRFATQMTVKGGRIATDPRLEEIEDARILTSGHRVSFVVGDGGSGKTTLLRRLAMIACDTALVATSKDSCSVPVLLKARDVLQAASLVEAIDSATITFTSECESAVQAEDYASGRVVVLIDGLDELAESTAVQDVLQLVAEFIDLHPNNRVCVTSRHLLPVREFTAANSIPLFEISDFSIKQASQIVRRAVTGAPAAEAAAVEVLRRLQDVHGMKLSPLLVTVFASTPNFQTSDIPPNLTSIFRKFANLMLGQWDLQKGLSQQYEYDLKHRVLANIALSWHLAKKTYATVDGFKGQVRELLEKIGHAERLETLTDEILRSGLLVVDGTAVAFRHLLLQEYFAGAAIESYTDVESAVADEWWRNVIVFSFGARPDRGDELLLLAKSVDSKPDPQQYRALITLGLALQACYMTGLTLRLELFSKIIGMLATLFSTSLRDFENASTYPLSSFIYHCLEVRSAVCTDLVMKADIPRVSAESAECLRFLRLAGAIEAGQILRVKTDVTSFDPADGRLLLGLHLLALFVMKLRVSTQDEREAAREISKAIAPKIQPLLQEVFDEFKGFVMELQQGSVMVLDAPLATPEGQYEMQLA